MAELSPFTWLGVGAVVLAVSLFMRELRFFAVVGVIFILFGGLRLLIKSRSKEQPGHTYHTKAPEPAAGKRRCFVCGTTNSAQANFCGHCGHRLRHEAS